MSEKIRVAIVFNDGGAVEQVISNSADIDFIYISADVEGSYDEDLIKTDNGNEYHAHNWHITADPAEVNFMDHVADLITKRDAEPCGDGADTPNP